MFAELGLKIGDNDKEILDISRALSSPERLEILKLLNFKSMTVKELSETLKSPMSTTLLNVNILNECNLIVIEETITKKGKSRLCSRTCDKIRFDIFDERVNVLKSQRFEIPIGNYISYEIPYEGGCGIATPKHIIGSDNDPDVFFDKERYDAGYIWFKQGFLKYRISNKTLPRKLASLSFSFEICSEAPFYRNDWKSEITLFVCEKEVGTWLSLGDYGGRRGRQNPSWWSDSITQFGVLTTWEIRKDGTYVNNEKISNFSIDQLDFKEENYISFDLGVKKDAKYVGGLSLFGKTFGDYDQDIIITAYWD